jgi:hypothetical protein
MQRRYRSSLSAVYDTSFAVISTNFALAELQALKKYAYFRYDVSRAMSLMWFCCGYKFIIEKESHYRHQTIATAIAAEGGNRLESTSSYPLISVIQQHTYAP